ncbi:kinase-like protein [Exidia glandulosa HHB12029]|uniref:Kinase-like protein n=1 Tax=Exidia glandulosa HHB12029 TaxID=1314781 RepID=A0A165FZE2_EXIGL|nr:kinase-like protein [Exidia glandulosa HHB12029]
MRLPFTPDASITFGDAFAQGGTASIQRGILHRSSESAGNAREEVVALKVLLIADPIRRQLFQREVDKWRALRHQRVLPFYGVCDVEEGMGMVALVAPYMSNENMALYLKRNPCADKIALLFQVAEGLQYLHEEARIVHGDIKAENVLITNAGNVLLADFGLSASLVPSGTCTRIRQMNTLRFTAPELLNYDEHEEGQGVGRKTCATDVYAFGMLVYQVMTGAHPWPKSNEYAVLLEIVQGCVPPRPTEIDDDLWDLCLRCWSIVPEYRPSISEGLRILVVIRRAKAGIPAITASARTMSLPIRRTTGSTSGESKRMNPYAVPFHPQRPVTLTSPATATSPLPSRTSSFSSSLYEIPTSANSPPSTMPPSRGSSFSSSSSSPSSLYKSSTSSAADSSHNSDSSPPSSVPTPSSSYAQLSPTKFAFNVYAKPFYPRTTHM